MSQEITKLTGLVQTVYGGNPPKTLQDLQSYIGRHTAKVKGYEDMAERDSGEKLSIIEEVNPKLHKFVTTVEFGKLQTVLNDLTTERLLLSIELILDRYVDLYLSDITLFVKMLASGRYEKPYGVPTPDYICRCFQEYYEGRENARADFRETRHSIRKAHENDGFARFDYTKMIAKAEADRIAKIEEKKNRKPVINTNQFKASDFEKQ